ncbi:RidA family protein [Paraburkholderia sp. RL17-347-BIC-D]|uniref:RidA family protein n=1 Tax=Paraburkholderia sp. RL17-347-BIC-D TaxID=3031632 RepID=UPI0038BCC464
MTTKEREEIDVPGAAPALSHYADAVRFGDTLFVSGVVALDTAGNIIGKGDVVQQTTAIFQSLERILAAAGASFADILKVTVLLIDVEHRTLINPIRQQFFGTHRPASTLIGVKALALPDILVEIEAIVGLPNR